MKRFLTVLVVLSLDISLFAAPKPNIVFILTDDLGINDLSCYGRKDHQTPHLDTLAKQGIRLTSSYCAQPICSPSRAAILTGKHPARLHLTTFLPGRADAPSQMLLHPKIEQQLPLAELTLAERLKPLGYTSACIGKWHLGGKGFLPQDQGFDVVYTGKANTTPSDTEGGKGEYELTREAVKFIEANAKKPFFLYLAHNTPHIPLAAKADLTKKYDAAFQPTYAAMMQTMDDCVGIVLNKLKELKLEDNTIVIFTSDNGGLHVLEFPESPATHNTPYRAGKGFLYEGGLRVPTIVRWPNTIKPNQISDVPMINTDWVPTILKAIGADIPVDLDGENVLPMLKGEKTTERTFFWHFPHYTNQGSRPAGAIRQGPWKAIIHYDTKTSELYNIEDDIGETKNLMLNNEARVVQMVVDLKMWKRKIQAQENEPNPNFDKTLFQKLYIDTDVSNMKPKATASETRQEYIEWRKLMNEVVKKKK